MIPIAMPIAARQSALQSVPLAGPEAAFNWIGSGRDLGKDWVKKRGAKGRK